MNANSWNASSFSHCLVVIWQFKSPAIRRPAHLIVFISGHKYSSILSHNRVQRPLNTNHTQNETNTKKRADRRIVHRCWAWACNDRQPHDKCDSHHTHKHSRSTHTNQQSSICYYIFVDHRSEIMNYVYEPRMRYGWVMRALVAVCLCFVLFHSPALFVLHFVFTFRRRSNYMSTARFSMACVWGTKRSHYLCSRPNRARF